MTKQLFPGVSEQDMENKEKQKQAKLEQDRKKAEEIKRAAEELKLKAEQEKQRQDFEKKVNHLYFRFGEFRKTLDKEIRRFIGKQATVLGIFYFMSLFGSIPHDAFAEKGINVFALAPSKTDFEAGDKKFSKQYYSSSKEDQELEKEETKKAFLAYLANPLKESYDFSTIFKKEAYKSFAESWSFKENDFIDWRVIRAYVGLIAVVLCATWNVQNIKEDKKEKTQHIRKILAAWKNNDFAKLDSLVNSYSEGSDVNIMMLKIISHLSKKDQTVFEKLITGDAKMSVETAVAVMEGHLQSHPEDMKLVLDTFDENSIPDIIKQKYTSKERNA
jgi:hypothetical protein